MELVLAILVLRRAQALARERATPPPCDGRLSMALCRCGAHVVHQRPPAEVQ
jgi:hypothetical protein